MNEKIKKITVEPCTEFGTIWHDFCVPKGSLCIVIYNANGKRDRYVLTSSRTYVRSNCSCFFIFAQVKREKWGPQYLPVSSKLGRLIQKYLDGRSFTATTFRKKPEPKQVKPRKETPYDGLEEMLPKMRNANYVFDGIRHKPFDFDNCDTPAGVINPYCWNEMYKNEPQVHSQKMKLDKPKREEDKPKRKAS